MMLRILTITTLVMSLTLAGCATTSAPLTPEQEARQKELQNKEERTKFNIVQNNKVGDIELVLREPRLNAEDELVIVTRGKTVGLATAITGLLVVSQGMTGGQTFSKNDVKGKVLEPVFKSPVLKYANTAFSTWISANAQSLAPAHKPLLQVKVTSQRFALVYPKLIGKESYALNTHLDITLQNHWDNKTAYQHFCQINSEPKTLVEWQANGYKAVDDTIKTNINACLKELDDKKAQISLHLSK